MASLLCRTAIAALALTAASCMAGPHQLRRSIDDWDHKHYVNSPWWNGFLWVSGIMPVGFAGAFVGDTLITDPYAFWFGDAWDRQGTGYEHLPVEAIDGRMGSLWLDRSGWTKISR
jgi:hypothetical protein